jgi:hypothetical protein
MILKKQKLQLHHQYLLYHLNQMYQKFLMSHLKHLKLKNHSDQMNLMYQN